ncbi:cysteine protease StiP domain-containing protein [Klebsiella pneumoniae]|uniref:cysteine protease StiP domain-containing protein n=1 Tax=Klebsiella pneumoniae TaxID=573 RepID=UPI003D9BB0E0
MLHPSACDGKTVFPLRDLSIIRDRGIDAAALDHIRYGTGGMNSVCRRLDGKRAITGELSRTLKDRPGYPEQPRLVVLADPCGCAWLAASDDD